MVSCFLIGPTLQNSLKGDPVLLARGCRKPRSIDLAQPLSIASQGIKTSISLCLGLAKGLGRDYSLGAMLYSTGIKEFSPGHAV